MTSDQTVTGVQRPPATTTATTTTATTGTTSPPGSTSRCALVADDEGVARRATATIQKVPAGAKLRVSLLAGARRSAAATATASRRHRTDLQVLEDARRCLRAHTLKRVTLSVTVTLKGDLRRARRATAYGVAGAWRVLARWLSSSGLHAHDAEADGAGGRVCGRVRRPEGVFVEPDDEEGLGVASDGVGPIGWLVSGRSP
jgi:hypothetical protein